MTARKGQSVTLSGEPQQEGIAARPWPGRRWLVMALAGVVLAALAVAGTMGAARYVSTFWLYRGFPPPSVPHSVVVHASGGTRQVPVTLPAVQTITVASPALGGYADRVIVVLPPGYASHPRQRYPVVYLLHGFPGLATGFLTIGQVAATEATLVAAGRMKPVILVLPTGTRSFLADEEWANGVRQGNGWETFVAADLVTAIDARYRTIASARGRGIAGLSEGGYGALNIGLHHPGEFGLVESWSGYMLADNIPAIFGTGPGLLDYNSPAKWIKLVAPQVRADHTYLWFYSGSTDPLAAQNRAFAAQLTALGVAHHFFESAGGHSWRLWRGQMPQALITASEHLSHG
jgi:enterochelin esterase-like enzyme